MKLNSFFQFSPDDKDNPLASDAEKAAEEAKKAAENAHPEEKSFLGKIKDALQDWSNLDQQQTDEDDTHV